MAFKIQTIPTTFVLKGHNVSGREVSNWPFSYENPGEPPVENTEPFLLYYKQSSSFATPNWNVPTPRYVSVPQSLLVQPKRTETPALPVYRFPRPPIRRQKRPGASDASYSRYLRKYGARLAIYDIKKAKYQAVYELRLAKYVRRIKAIEANRIRETLRLNASFLRKIGVIVPSTNNPYNYTSYRDSGWKCNFIFQLKFDIQVNDYGHYTSRVYGPGPYIERERCGYGSQSGIPSSFRSYGQVGDHFPPVLPNSSPPAALVAEATAKSVAQLYEKTKNSAAHVGNMLAERAQTYTMLTTSFARLRAFAHSPKKTVLKYITGRNNTKRVGNDFIQYCFGVEPLAKDVYAALERLSDSMNDINKSDMVKVRSGGSASWNDSYVIDGGYFKDEVLISYQVRVRHMVEFRVDNSALATLGQFGLINPAEIAWEVTPWSFLVDWVLPIGEYISNLSATTGMTYRTGTTSTKITTHRSVKRTYKYYEPLWKHGLEFYGTLERFVEDETKTREILTTMPRVPLPRFKNPFSPRHFLLSLALWRQRI